MNLEFKGKHLEFLQSDAPERDLEGSRNCGKTTVALWSELEAARKYPGIWILLCRWTDEAARTLLKPAFEQLARIHGTEMEWNREENAFEIENGSRAFCFGLKTQSQKAEDRYGKIRGLPVSRIYGDQPEQFPGDVGDELRACLRPDLEAKVKQQRFPHQLTFTPNPPDENHWIAKQFPEKNNIKGRRYWCLSLFDNAHNLPPETIESLLRTYPPEHPKHRTVILGRRGLNVIGDAVYENLYDRTAHCRELQPNPEGQFLEAIEVGQHSPCWIIAQRTLRGGLWLLGGLIGRRMMLEDFLPLVTKYRDEWFPRAQYRTATGPMGETISTSGSRFTLLSLLRAANIAPVWRPNANAPDVHLAMIEAMAGMLRRRIVAREEAIGIEKSADRWLVASAEGIEPQPFMSFAFEGGFVWHEGLISVNNKAVRYPHNDDWFYNVMRCVDHIMLNFCAGQPSEYEQEEARRLEAEQRMNANRMRGPRRRQIWG